MLVRLQNGGAKLGTGPTKKSERQSAVLQRVKSIHFRGDRQHRQPVSIVQGYGKAQKRQLPGAQRPGVPFTARSVCTHEAASAMGGTGGSIGTGESVARAGAVPNLARASQIL